MKLAGSNRPRRDQYRVKVTRTARLEGLQLGESIREGHLPFWMNEFRTGKWVLTTEATGAQQAKDKLLEFYAIPRDQDLLRKTGFSAWQIEGYSRSDRTVWSVVDYTFEDVEAVR